MAGTARGRGNVWPALPTPSPYDGPGSGPGTSNTGGSAGRRQGSNAPSVASQRSAVGPPSTSPRVGQEGTPSIATATSSYGAPAPSMLTDPARDNPPRATDQLRLIEGLPASCYNFDRQYQVPVITAKRAGFNKTGKEVTMTMNSFMVQKFPTMNAYQYDVHIGSGAEKRVVIEKVWQSKARKNQIPIAMLFDGNKLGWSSQKLPNGQSRVTFEVDLDAEQGRRPGKNSNTFRVIVTQSKTLNVACLEAWVEGKISFDDNVIQALNFLQHLMKEGPASSGKFLVLRNKFFDRKAERTDLGGGVEVVRGYFQSLRPAHPGRMVVNLDVATTCFWRPIGLANLILAKFDYKSIYELEADMWPKKGNDGRERQSVVFPQLKQFKKVRVTPTYTGCPCIGREFTINKFIPMNAKEYTLEYKDLKTGKTIPNCSVFDYFRIKYNVTLARWKFPLVEMTKKGVVYPVEVLQLLENQKYHHKLNPDQTSKMIKFAVSRPNVRLQGIQQGHSLLNWKDDQHMKKFGLTMAPDMIRTKARLLPNPKIQFAGSQTDPMTKGRWDLKNKKFYKCPAEGLTSWCIGWLGEDIVDQKIVETWAQLLMKTYRAHGGKVNTNPLLMRLPKDASDAAMKCHNDTGNYFQKKPQLCIVLVPNKDSLAYNRLKKSFDCRWGVCSQVLQVSQIVKLNPQYASNVLMKINAKLGGCTAKSVSNVAAGSKAGKLKPKTMIIGADVSHASPGSDQPSIAALSVSMDLEAIKYAACVQTNGIRVEMITDFNFKGCLMPLVRKWVSDVGGGSLPEHVYYMRDGVSEGQYQHVLQMEVPRIRETMKIIQGRDWTGKITVIIASKRHHIRAFPADKIGMDANGNPLPGVLIERDCTSPHDWDFYLYSHFALQGTSRPVHYAIIQDDAKHEPEFTQNMIYEHCYQYMRSTTSVSLHPAVFYAHLASNRGRCHENAPSSDPPRGGPGFKMTTKNVSESTPPPTEVPMLLSLPENLPINWVAWYI